ncbi:MAG TPA: EthD family reductase [Pseudolysinimonas sp.]|nr:EthD family reductase [Pseudolysinimonas sp.]
MFTIAFLTKRRPDLSLDEYLHHYEKVHFPLAVKLPGLVSYTQQPIVHGGWNGTDSFPEYDGLSLYTFESKDEADAAFASPAGVALNEDTGLFMDWPSVLSIPVETLQQFVRS